MENKEMLVKAGKRMLHSNLTVETWGNISIRDPKSGKIYLTPSAMNYDSCCSNDIVVCDINGEILEGNRKPTIEKDLHLSVYRNRPEVNAIVHTHPIYSMVFACTGMTIPPVIDEAAQVLGGDVQVADYALPGTLDLAQKCVEALGKQTNACLLQSHGAVCVGDSIDMAFKVATVLEMTAQIYTLILQTGKVPIAISESNIQIMREFAENHYGQDK